MTRSTAWSLRDMPSLRDRRALVTGASSGVGGAVVDALVEHGAEVLMAGRDAQQLRAAVARQREDGARVHPLLVDLET